MHFHQTTLGLAATALLSTAMLTMAHAQNAANLPANIPPPGGVSSRGPVGVGIVAGPPAGFNVLTASPAERSRHVIPPEPDATNAPKAHAAWLRAMTAAAAAPPSQVPPVLTQTDIEHRPHQPGPGQALPTQPKNGVASTTSNNWSGEAVYYPNAFSTEAIVAEFTVPTAQQAYGACTGGWDWSSFWVGIDGFGSADVLQAGVEADAYCSGGSTAAYYSAWIEWYPYGSVRVSNPAVGPGDVIFVEVWNTSPTQGYAYLYNYSRGGTGQSYSLTAYPGYPLTGSSVEWVVERPSVGGSLANLTNYIGSAWPFGYAWNYTSGSPTYYYEGQNPASGTLYGITMLDNGGNGISSATVENADFLWFHDFGSAF